MNWKSAVQTPVVDLHCHLLPGIDDGPATMDEALAMARMAVDNGITHAVVTPHLHPGRWENTLTTALPVFTEFKRAVEKAQIPLQLGLACEARLDADLLVHLKEGELPFLGTLDDHKLMLLELPHGQIPLGADRFAAKMLEMGIRPVIAHPERNKKAMRDRSSLAVFEEMGCLFQITAGSLLGKFGEAAEELAIELLESSSTHLIASDAHNTRVRIPELLTAKEVAASVLGETAAMALVSDNPWRIASGHFATVETRVSVLSERSQVEVQHETRIASPARGRKPLNGHHDEHGPDGSDACKPRSESSTAPGTNGARAADSNDSRPLQGVWKQLEQSTEQYTGPNGRPCLQSPLDIRLRVDMIRRLAMHLPTQVLGPLAEDIEKMSRSGR
jgi:protein-tyrosine phosphatase